MRGDAELAEAQEVRGTLWEVEGRGPWEKGRRRQTQGLAGELPLLSWRPVQEPRECRAVERWGSSSPRTCKGEWQKGSPALGALPRSSRWTPCLTECGMERKGRKVRELWRGLGRTAVWKAMWSAGTG